MRIVRNAAHAVQQNLPALVLYAAIIAGADLGAMLIALPFEGAAAESATAIQRSIDIGLLLIVIHIAAAVQSIVFSRMGKEIDKPLWKVRDDRDALGRFFLLWAVINLVTNGLYPLAHADFGSGEGMSINYLLFLLWLALFVISVPFGACIMFSGRVNARGLGENLAPLTRQPGDTAAVIGIMLFQVLLVIYLSQLLGGGQERAPLAMRIGVTLAADIICAYLDCLAFAGTWIICMTDRETIDEIDLDF